MYLYTQQEMSNPEIIVYIQRTQIPERMWIVWYRIKWITDIAYYYQMIMVKIGTLLYSLSGSWRDVWGLQVKTL